MAEGGYAPLTPAGLSSVPLYDPTKDNARAWLEVVERHSRAFRWSEVDRLTVARCRLTGEALIWEGGLGRHLADWDAFRSAFLERYAARNDELHAELANCRQGPDQTVREYADRFRHLMAQLGLDGNQDPIYMYKFMGGLQPWIYDFVYMFRPNNLDAAILSAIYGDGMKLGRPQGPQPRAWAPNWSNQAQGPRSNNTSPARGDDRVVRFRDYEPRREARSVTPPSRFRDSEPRQQPERDERSGGSERRQSKSRWPERREERGNSDGAMPNRSKGKGGEEDLVKAFKRLSVNVADAVREELASHRRQSATTPTRGFRRDTSPPRRMMQNQPGPAPVQGGYESPGRWAGARPAPAVQHVQAGMQQYAPDGRVYQLVRAQPSSAHTVHMVEMAPDGGEGPEEEEEYYEWVEVTPGMEGESVMQTAAYSPYEEVYLKRFGEFQGDSLPRKRPVVAPPPAGSRPASGTPQQQPQQQQRPAPTGNEPAAPRPPAPASQSLPTWPPSQGPRPPPSTAAAAPERASQADETRRPVIGPDLAPRPLPDMTRVSSGAYGSAPANRDAPRPGAQQNRPGFVRPHDQTWRTRALEAPSNRADPVPGDSGQTEAQLANDVVSKVLKYSIPLGTAMSISPLEVSRKAATKLLGLTRVKGGFNNGRVMFYDGDVAVAALDLGQDQPPRVLEAAAEGVNPATLASPPRAPPPRPSVLATSTLAEGGHRYQVCRTSILVADASNEWVRVAAIIDTGASVSLISRHTLRVLHLSDAIRTTEVSFFNADGNRSRAGGHISGLLTSTGDLQMPINAFVSNSLGYGILLGCDWLAAASATICYQTGLLHYTNDQGGRGSLAISFKKGDGMPQPTLALHDIATDVSDVETYLVNNHGVSEDTAGHGVEDQGPSVGFMMSEEDYCWLAGEAGGNLAAALACHFAAPRYRPRPSSVEIKWEPLVAMVDVAEEPVNNLTPPTALARTWQRAGEAVLQQLFPNARTPVETPEVLQRFSDMGLRIVGDILLKSLIIFSARAAAGGEGAAAARQEVSARQEALLSTRAEMRRRGLTLPPLPIGMRRLEDVPLIKRTVKAAPTEAGEATPPPAAAAEAASQAVGAAAASEPQMLTDLPGGDVEDMLRQYRRRLAEAEVAELLGTNPAAVRRLPRLRRQVALCLHEMHARDLTIPEFDPLVDMVGQKALGDARLGEYLAQREKAWAGSVDGIARAPSAWLRPELARDGCLPADVVASETAQHVGVPVRESLTPLGELNVEQLTLMSRQGRRRAGVYGMKAAFGGRWTEAYVAHAAAHAHYAAKVEAELASRGLDARGHALPEGRKEAVRAEVRCAPAPAAAVKEGVSLDPEVQGAALALLTLSGRRESPRRPGGREPRRRRVAETPVMLQADAAVAARDPLLEEWAAMYEPVPGSTLDPEGDPPMVMMLEMVEEEWEEMLTEPPPPWRTAPPADPRVRPQQTGGAELDALPYRILPRWPYFQWADDADDREPPSPSAPAAYLVEASSTEEETTETGSREPTPSSADSGEGEQPPRPDGRAPRAANDDFLRQLTAVRAPPPYLAPHEREEVVPDAFAWVREQHGGRTPSGSLYGRAPLASRGSESRSGRLPSMDPDERVRRDRRGEWQSSRDQSSGGGGEEDERGSHKEGPRRPDSYSGEWDEEELPLSGLPFTRPRSYEWPEPVAPRRAHAAPLSVLPAGRPLSQFPTGNAMGAPFASLSLWAAGEQIAALQRNSYVVPPDSPPRQARAPPRAGMTAARPLPNPRPSALYLNPTSQSSEERRGSARRDAKRAQERRQNEQERQARSVFTGREPAGGSIPFTPQARDHYEPSGRGGFRYEGYPRAPQPYEGGYPIRDSAWPRAPPPPPPRRERDSGEGADRRLPYASAPATPGPSYVTSSAETKHTATLVHPEPIPAPTAAPAIDQAAGAAELEEGEANPEQGDGEEEAWFGFIPALPDHRASPATQELVCEEQLSESEAATPMAVEVAPADDPAGSTPMQESPADTPTCCMADAEEAIATHVPEPADPRVLAHYELWMMGFVELLKASWGQEGPLDGGQQRVAAHGVVLCRAMLRRLAPTRLLPRQGLPQDLWDWVRAECRVVKPYSRELLELREALVEYLRQDLHTCRAEERLRLAMDRWQGIKTAAGEETTPPDPRSGTTLEKLRMYIGGRPQPTTPEVYLTDNGGVPPPAEAPPAEAAVAAACQAPLPVGDETDLSDPHVPHVEKEEPATGDKTTTLTMEPTEAELREHRTWDDYTRAKPLAGALAVVETANRIMKEQLKEAGKMEDKARYRRWWETVLERQRALTQIAELGLEPPAEVAAPPPGWESWLEEMKENVDAALARMGEPLKGGGNPPAFRLPKPPPGRKLSESAVQRRQLAFLAYRLWRAWVNPYHTPDTRAEACDPLARRYLSLREKVAKRRWLLAAPQLPALDGMAEKWAPSAYRMPDPYLTPECAWWLWYTRDTLLPKHERPRAEEWMLAEAQWVGRRGLLACAQGTDGLAQAREEQVAAEAWMHDYAARESGVLWPPTATMRPDREEVDSDVEALIPEGAPEQAPPVDYNPLVGPEPPSTSGGEATCEGSGSSGDEVQEEECYMVDRTGPYDSLVGGAQVIKACREHRAEGRMDAQELDLPPDAKELEAQERTEEGDNPWPPFSLDTVPNAKTYAEAARATSQSARAVKVTAAVKVETPARTPPRMARGAPGALTPGKSPPEQAGEDEAELPAPLGVYQRERLRTSLDLWARMEKHFLRPEEAVEAACRGSAPKPVCTPVTGGRGFWKGSPNTTTDYREDAIAQERMRLKEIEQNLAALWAPQVALPSYLRPAESWRHALRRARALTRLVSCGCKAEDETGALPRKCLQWLGQHEGAVADAVQQLRPPTLRVSDPPIFEAGSARPARPRTFEHRLAALAYVLWEEWSNPFYSENDKGLRLGVVSGRLLWLWEFMARVTRLSKGEALKVVASAKGWSRGSVCPTIPYLPGACLKELHDNKDYMITREQRDWGPRLREWVRVGPAPPVPSGWGWERTPLATWGHSEEDLRAAARRSITRSPVVDPELTLKAWMEEEGEEGRALYYALRGAVRRGLLSVASAGPRGRPPLRPDGWLDKRARGWRNVFAALRARTKNLFTRHGAALAYWGDLVVYWSSELLDEEAESRGDPAESFKRANGARVVACEMFACERVSRSLFTHWACLLRRDPMPAPEEPELEDQEEPPSPPPPAQGASQDGGDKSAGGHPPRPPPDNGPDGPAGMSSPQPVEEGEEERTRRGLREVELWLEEGEEEAVGQYERSLGSWLVLLLRRAAAEGLVRVLPADQPIGGSSRVVEDSLQRCVPWWQQAFEQLLGWAWGLCDWELALVAAHGIRLCDHLKQMSRLGPQTGLPKECAEWRIAVEQLRGPRDLWVPMRVALLCLITKEERRPAEVARGEKALRAWLTYVRSRVRRARGVPGEYRIGDSLWTTLAELGRADKEERASWARDTNLLPAFPSRPTPQESFSPATAAGPADPGVPSAGGHPAKEDPKNPKSSAAGGHPAARAIARAESPPPLRAAEGPVPAAEGVARGEPEEEQVEHVYTTDWYSPEYSYGGEAARPDGRPWQLAADVPPPPSYEEVIGLTLAQHIEKARRYAAECLKRRPSAEPDEEMRGLIEARVNSELPAPDRAALLALLTTHHDMFARNNRELGKTSWVTLKIDTGDSPPIYKPPYRLGIKEREVVEAEIAKLYEDGIIEPSNSAWSSPVMVIKKPNGGYRCVIDLRGVNSVCKVIRYPLGHIQDLLDAVAPPVGQQRWMSSLDLRSGFWAVPIDPADRDKTAFHTTNSGWRFVRMPMGLSCAPPVWAELMRRVLAPVLIGGVPTRSRVGETGGELPATETLPAPRQCAIVYMDDVLICSPTMEAHLQDVETVLNLLRLAGLRVSASKCEFGRRRIVFLGHTLDGERGTLEPNPKNVAAIEAFPSPRNVRQVKAFMGMASYYRTLIPGLSVTARPLFALLKKEAAWRWGPEEEAAFQEIKRALTSKPVVRAPDFSRDFYKTAVAAVLSQKDDDGNEYVVKYASRKLTDSESRTLNSSEGEALAACWGVRHFRNYLWGTHFYLVSDSMTVRYIRTAGASDLSGRLARYAFKLMSYQFTPVHRPGEKHGNADGLSRLGHMLGGDDEDEGGEQVESADARSKEAALVAMLQGPPPVGAVPGITHAAYEEVYMTDGCTEAYRTSYPPPLPLSQLRQRATGATGGAYGDAENAVPPPPPSQAATLPPRASARRVLFASGVAAAATTPSAATPLAPTAQPEAGPGEDGGLVPVPSAAEWRRMQRPPLTPRPNAAGPGSSRDDAAGGSRGGPPPSPAGGQSSLTPAPPEEEVGLAICLACRQELPAERLALCCAKECPGAWCLDCLKLPTAPRGRWECPMHSALWGVSWGPYYRIYRAYTDWQTRSPPAGDDDAAGAAPQPRNAPPVEAGAYDLPTEDLTEEPEADAGQEGEPGGDLAHVLEAEPAAEPAGESEEEGELAEGQEDEEAAEEGGPPGAAQEAAADGQPGEGEADEDLQEFDDGGEEDLEEAPDRTEGGRKEQPIWLDDRTLAYVRDRQLPSAQELAQWGTQAAKELERIRRRARRYRWVDGELTKLPTAKCDAARRVPPPAQRSALILDHHERIGHLGVDRTYASVARELWWEGMRADVKAVVRECGACRAQKQVLLRETCLTPHDTVPWNYRVHVDLCGPLARTRRGARYLMVCQDAWGRWPEVMCLPEKSSLTVWLAFYQQWVCRWGPPVQCCTDRGTEFQGVFHAGLTQHRCKHLLTEGRRPQSNGMAERYIATIVPALRRMITREVDWDLAVYRVVAGYRSTPHSVTRISPSLAVTGIEMASATARPVILPNEEEGEIAEEDLDIPWSNAHAVALEARGRRLRQVDDDITRRTDHEKRLRVARFEKAQAAKALKRQRSRRAPTAALATAAPGLTDEGEPDGAAPPPKRAAAAAPTRAPVRREPEAESMDEGEEMGGVSGRNSPEADGPHATGAPEEQAARPSDQPEVWEVPAHVLPHIPDIPTGTLVYMKLFPRSGKLKPRHEGPWEFQYWKAPGASHAVVKAGDGSLFPIARRRLMVPRECVQPAGAEVDEAEKTPPPVRQQPAVPPPTPAKRAATGGLPARKEPQNDSRGPRGSELTQHEEHLLSFTSPTPRSQPATALKSAGGRATPRRGPLAGVVSGGRGGGRVPIIPTSFTFRQGRVGKLSPAKTKKKALRTAGGAAPRAGGNGTPPRTAPQPPTASRPPAGGQERE